MRICDYDPKDLKTGMKVKSMNNPERTGRIIEIQWEEIHFGKSVAIIDGPIVYIKWPDLRSESSWFAFQLQNEVEED